MASINTHLAIAKRYIEKHKGEITNIIAFLDGSIAPDDTTNKEQTHYGKRTEKHDLEKINREKINLCKFLEHNTIEKDFDRGVFLHLYTDWEYYNNFLPADYIKSTSISDFNEDNPYTSDYHHDYLMDKYSLSYEATSKNNQLLDLVAGWKKRNFERWETKGIKRKILFTRTKLDAFIERISSVDLDLLAQKTLNPAKQ